MAKGGRAGVDMEFQRGKGADQKDVICVINPKLRCFPAVPEGVMSETTGFVHPMAFVDTNGTEHIRRLQ